MKILPDPSSLVSMETIQKAINSLDGSYKTSAVKRAFASLFKGTEYGVYSKISDYDEKEELLDECQEWLFDLVVLSEDKWKEDRRQPFVTDTILALESELECKFNHIMYDFQKLLVTNAHFKVMLFRCHSDEMEDYYSYMAENIRKYKSSNGTFFLVCYRNNLGNYKVEEITAT